MNLSRQYLLLIILSSLGRSATAKEKEDEASCANTCRERTLMLMSWCQHCSDHCPSGTRAECEQICKTRCEGEKRSHGDSHVIAVHFCDGAGWKACLMACASQQHCRDNWCEENAPHRQICLNHVNEAAGGCAMACRSSREKCSE